MLAVCVRPAQIMRRSMVRATQCMPLCRHTTHSRRCWRKSWLSTTRQMQSWTWSYSSRLWSTSRASAASLTSQGGLSVECWPCGGGCLFWLYCAGAAGGCGAVPGQAEQHVCVCTPCLVVLQGQRDAGGRRRQWQAVPGQASCIHLRLRRVPDRGQLHLWCRGLQGGTAGTVHQGRRQGAACRVPHDRQPDCEGAVPGVHQRPAVNGHRG